MFREDYQKAQDAIQAPDSLRERIREQIKQDDAPSFAESFERPKKIWPRVLGYSGAAVAVAVLAILIIRPFRLPKPQTAKSAEVPMMAAQADAVAAEEAAPAESISESKALAAGRTVTTDAVMGDGDTGMDDYEPYMLPEQTYTDIFHAIAPSEPTEEAAPTAEEAVPAAAIDEAITIADGSFGYGEQTAALPAGELKAAVHSDAHIFLVTEADNRTTITIYDEALLLVGFAAIDGNFDRCELRDSTVFDEQYALVTRRTFLLYTTWRFRAETAEEQRPETYCPSVTDHSGTRVLTAEEISLVNSGDFYTAYLAVTWDGGVEILYTFAEMGV